MEITSSDDVNNCKNPTGSLYMISNITLLTRGYHQLCRVEGRYKIMINILKHQMDEWENIGVCKLSEEWTNCIAGGTRVITLQHRNEFWEMSLHALLNEVLWPSLYKPPIAPNLPNLLFWIATSDNSCNPTITAKVSLSSHVKVSTSKVVIFSMSWQHKLSKNMIDFWKKSAAK